jgi:peroxiredoxin
MSMTQPCSLRLFAAAAIGGLLIFSGGASSIMGQADEANKDGPAEGHSYHGAVFNEGPRQAAVLLPGTGDVNFPVTTSSPEAQMFFNQGIGQLHGFWDFEAERSFRQAAAIDPDCAMAYWGMAQANFDNVKRVEGFMKEAVARKDKVSDRERIYIEGLAKYFDDPKKDTKVRLRDLVRVYENVMEKYPEDLEAKAFLAKQLYFNNKSGIKYTSHYTHDLLIAEILAADPDHPAHHYRIHLWDGEKPEKVIPSAALCGPAAPGIAHMWHMPGHTYSKLKRYHDASWQQEASARIDHAHMIRYQIVPDQIHNFAHNNEWLIRNLNHLGRVDEALDLARNMIELPRLAKFEGEGDKKKYKPNGSWRYGRQRLRDTLLRFELWDSLIAHAENSQYLKPDPVVIPELEWNRVLAIAKFESGDHAGGSVHLEKIETLLADQTAKRDKAVADAESKAREAKKNDKQIEESKKAAEKNFSKELTARENAANEVGVYAALNAQPADTARALELLPKLKNLAKARHATLWSRAGNQEKALELAKQAVDSGKSEVHPLAVQVALLNEAGKTEDAKAAFEKLRTVGATADLDIPMLQRLAPIAQAFGYPEDWRTPPAPAEDLGKRPALDKLGPFRWSPPIAPEWTLKEANGEPTSLSDFKGRPVLVIFYLGKECSHCMDQLNNFAPRHDAYLKAGIPIVAVSTDTAEGLAATFQKTPDAQGNPRNPFPFPLLSNADLDSFKAYRAFDDFENLALHGTFLIDGEGHIRWQDISYEPFMHAEWLLEECQRLLSFDES